MTDHATSSPAAGAAGDHHPTTGYTFAACFCGWALIAMDVQILTPAKSLTEAVRAADDAGVVLLGTATLLASAFGGWLAGVLSDWIGRVPVLRYTVACAALFTFLSGYVQSYAAFFLCRILMGVGFGGVWAAAAVMVAEAFTSRRGWWVGFMHSGWAAGWALASFAMPALAPFLSQQFHISVWQALLWSSAALALPVLLLSLFVAESPVYVNDRKIHSGEVDFLEIFSPSRLWATFLTCVLSIGTLTGYYVTMLWLPQFLLDQKLILESYATMLSLPQFLADQKLILNSYSFFLIAGAFAGYVVSAWFSDLDPFKRRGNFVLFALFALLTVVACLAIADNGIEGALGLKADARQKIILGLAFPVGFFTSGAISGMGAFFAELFPTRMRGSGLGLAYNFGRGFAAFILWLVGATGANQPEGLLSRLLDGLSSLLPPEFSALPQLGLAIGAAVGIAYLLVVIAALLLPETRDRTDLTQIA